MNKKPVIFPSINVELEEFRSRYFALYKSSNPLLQRLLSYVLKGNGKMMRPILILLTAKYFGPIQEKIYHVSSALELLHTGSLVHDDVVDNSSERRGNLSVNEAFSNKQAVLLGDYIVAMSLEEALKSGNIQIVQILSMLAMKLSEGEIIQLNSRKDNALSEELYFDIIKKKTASLFSSCSRSAALVCNATAQELDAFEQFGFFSGICFQIKDDIFDYFKSKEIGKPFGNDLREGKFTLPAIYALNKSGQDWESRIAAVKSCVATDNEIGEIIDFTVAHGGVSYAEQKMREYRNKAINSLPLSMDKGLRDCFETYIDVIIGRSK
ncbi:MAG TPA: polyprenyl synthetase family protein [Bacteroidaceae bacterium]|nr:polyprenyl synthetase family protein [Bacteroidaceae bacterium]